MAAEETFFGEELQKFQICSKKLSKLVYKESEDFRAELKNILDDFNSVEYSLKLVKEEVAGEILAKCCYLASYRDSRLVSAVSQLVVNLISRQQLVLATEIHTITEYIIKCLRESHSDSKVDLLRALSAVLYENTHNLSQYHDDLIGEKGILILESESTRDDVQRSNTQCLENICLRVPGYSYIDDECQTRCYEVLLKLVHCAPPQHQDDANHCRRVVSCVRGLHNLVIATKTCPQEYIGPILAALKLYMLYGLPGQETTILPTLYPRTVPLADTPKVSTPQRKVLDEGSGRAGDGKSPARRGRKKTRGRGAAARSGGRAEEGARAGIQNLSLYGGSGESPSPDAARVPPAPGSNEHTVQSLLQPWRHGYSSESDVSDTEGGPSAKLRGYHSNVRHCSLGCLHAIVKTVDKRVMFGYWNSFLPDSPVAGAPTQGHTLFTCIMKDTSPKARSGALVVLSSLVEGTKQYLLYADDTEQSPAAFTPFSISLGYMVKELHRGLLFALAAENSPLVLTQIFKCLAVLVPNVPYQKLRPGLLNRIIKHVKPFLAHREPNIRVACLTCLGSVVSVQAPMMEVWQALQATPPTAHNLVPPLTPTRDQPGNTSIPESRSRNNSESASSLESPRVVSGAITPILSSGSITPSLADSTVGSVDLPWVVRLCLNNVIPGLGLVDRGADWSASRSIHTQPQPVKLESLQLLALLSKGYFMLVKDCLLTICELIQKCLEDSDPSIQLHGAKLLEELAAAIVQQLRQALPAETVDISQVEELWVRILSGPLTRVLQEPAHYAVRATACDCLANVGPQVFERLQVDKRMLCITLLLGFTSDTDYHVRASAVRALGVYVLYPCLRDDVSFVADVANVIINALQENNLSVKVKAAWSLGNLSDALVLNRDAGEEAFIEDFADMLLLKLFEVATKASHDNDKVKANAVRGLGSLLRYLPPRSYNSVRFSDAVELGIKSLVKTITTGTMKIRWNACYATANMFHNGLLPLGQVGWTNEIHAALASVVKSCKNFKVRINAAMAFSIPRERRCYGQPPLFKDIWVSLVVGLVESETVGDFTELKYRDSLTEQVCKTLLHLMSLVEPKDLEEVGPALEPHLEALYPYVQQWYQQTLAATDTKVMPEELVTAKEHLEELEKGSLNETQMNAVKQLLSIIDMAQRAQTVADKKLLWLIEATEKDEPPASSTASGFSQTFD